MSVIKIALEEHAFGQDPTLGFLPRAGAISKDQVAITVGFAGPGKSRVVQLIWMKGLKMKKIIDVPAFKVELNDDETVEPNEKKLKEFFFSLMPKEPSNHDFVESILKSPDPEIVSYFLYLGVENVLTGMERMGFITRSGRKNEKKIYD
jgi:hypothetical protein